MKERFSFGTSFMVGLVAGILIMNFGKSILLENTGLLDENILRQMSSAFPDSDALFAFVLRKRLMLMVMLVIVSTTYLGVAVSMFLAGWFGFSAGAFLAAAVIRYGFKGILLAAAATLPQYLVLGPVFYGLFVWCGKTCRMIYGRSHHYAGDAKTPILWGRVLPLVILFAGIYIGCFLESHVNPGILQGFLKIL